MDFIVLRGLPESKSTKSLINLLVDYKSMPYVAAGQGVFVQLMPRVRFTGGYLDKNAMRQRG
ncbi:hypothetical protein ACLKOZ_00460 [Arthrobacter sp. R4]|uniref:hypothetical protein n=1 Tax=Arthrobacter sp. R4 TaxID=644417 RepID=UPI003ED8B3C5